MKRLTLILASLAALFALAACGAQTQSPQVEGQANANEQPAGGSTAEQTSAEQDTSADSQSDNSQGGDSRGEIIVDEDRDDPSDRDADDNLQSGQQLPADFPVPVPDDYRVEAVGEAGNETSVVLEAPSGEDAYNYYRQALADAGFRVVDEGSNQGGYFEAELEFSDRDLEGNADFSGDTIEIETEQYR